VGGVALAWGLATDVGHSRSVNEDSALAAAALFVVADGMGGHAAGDVASGLVIDRFRSLSEDATDDGPLRDVDAMLRVIDDANSQIFTAGAAAGDAASMGTTIVGLALVENGPSVSWLVVNVGDSRAYRYFAGELELLSTDHSYVQELVDAGRISSGDARRHPQRNVVTRALGMEPVVSTDVWVREPIVGERFVLCSDGLSSELDDESIAVLAGSDSEPEQLAAALVAAALDHGGRDNVTVLIVDVVAVLPGTEDDDHVTAPRHPVDGSSDGTTSEDDARSNAAAPAVVIDGVPSWLGVTSEPSQAPGRGDGAEPNELIVEGPGS
jgi:protein phosphatase